MGPMILRDFRELLRTLLVIQIQIPAKSQAVVMEWCAHARVLPVCACVCAGERWGRAPIDEIYVPNLLKGNSV